MLLQIFSAKKKIQKKKKIDGNVNASCLSLSLIFLLHFSQYYKKLQKNKIHRTGTTYILI